MDIKAPLDSSLLGTSAISESQMVWHVTLQTSPRQPALHKRNNFDKAQLCAI